MCTARRILVLAAAILVPLGYPAKSVATDFAAPKSYPVGTGPALIVTGDFNGDGKLDLAVANTGSNDVSILLNNGDGTFKAALSSPAGVSPQGMVAGDFNGDGKLDLMVINAGSAPSTNGGVFFLAGIGNGKFQGPVQVQGNSFPVSIAVADLNEDGKLDLVLGDGASDGIFVLLGKGDGTFQQPTSQTLDGTVRVLAIGDFNGDKHADVVAYITPPGLTTTVLLLPGKGDGTFGSSTEITTFGGTNALGSTSVKGGVALLPGDFNGDGKLDLMWRFLSQSKITVNVFGHTCSVSDPCYSYKTNVQLFTGNGDGTFGAGTFAISESGPQFSKNSFYQNPGNISAGDFNADNKADLLFLSLGAGDLSLGVGDGSFFPSDPKAVAALPPLWTGEGPFAAVADLNGDNLPDAVVTDPANNAIIVVLNTSPTSGADLGVSFSAPVPATFVIGTGDLTYSAAVRSEGPQDATGVTLTETPPAGLKFVSATPSQGTCTGTTTITCDLGAMKEPSGAQVDFAFTPTTPGTFTTTVQVAGSQPDLNSKNDSASFTVTAVLPADISVSGSASRTTASTGDQVTYSIQVSNAGPGDAANVTLTDAISDAGLTVSSMSVSQGACTSSPGNISCAIGTLAKDAKVSISFVITMGPAENLTNQLSLTSDTPDLNTADNSTTLTVLVNPANLAVSQTASAQSVAPGTQVTYTITVKNNGPSQATNVVLIDTVPAGTTIAAVQASQGSCAPPGNGVLSMSCALGTLAASASATVSFGATYATAGTMTNAVEATSEAPDPDTSDNSSSLDVTVAQPDFSISPATTSLTLKRGGSVSDVLTFAGQGGFAGNIDLKCSVSGPTPMPTCAISPSSVTPGNTATLTISAATLTAGLVPWSFPGSSASSVYALCLPPLSALGLVVAGRFSRQRRGLWMLCALVVVAAVLPVACGGGSSSGPPPPQSFSVTVTATANPGGMQHTTLVNVTVQ